MSRETCYDNADVTGNIAGNTAGAVTYGMLAGPTIEAGTIPAAFAGAVVGEGVNHATDSLGQHVCDQMYESSLAAVDFDPHTNIVSYAFEHENSSQITFETYDMTCDAHNEGLCIPAESDPGDHAASGTDSID